MNDKHSSILPNLPPKGLFLQSSCNNPGTPSSPPGIPPLKAEKSASIISQDLAFLSLECPCIVIYKLHKCDSIVISENYPNLPGKCNQLINYATFVLCLLNFLRCKFKTKKRLISSNISRIIKCALISHYPF